MAQDMTTQALLEYVKTLKPSGGGGEPTVVSYNSLTDKPQIEGVTLSGNKTFPQLNLDVLANSEIQDIFDNLT